MKLPDSFFMTPDVWSRSNVLQTCRDSGVTVTFLTESGYKSMNDGLRRVVCGAAQLFFGSSLQNSVEAEEVMLDVSGCF